MRRDFLKTCVASLVGFVCGLGEKVSLLNKRPSSCDIKEGDLPKLPPSPIKLKPLFLITPEKMELIEWKDVKAGQLLLEVDSYGKPYFTVFRATTDAVPEPRRPGNYCVKLVKECNLGPIVHHLALQYEVETVAVVTTDENQKDSYFTTARQFEKKLDGELYPLNRYEFAPTASVGAGYAIGTPAKHVVSDGIELTMGDA